MALRITRVLFAAVFQLLILYLVFRSARKTFQDAPIEETPKAVIEITSSPEPPSQTPVVSAPSPSVEKPYSIEEEVSNSTLGFQKILGISLPERADRRALLQLAAKNHDVQIDWMDAVKGSDLPKASWPASWEQPYEGHILAPGEVGNWQSHRNALQRVIDSDYSTALVIEDDADWDVSLKSQLARFAYASRKLENRERPLNDLLGPRTRTFSPYGSKWDLLWLGICANPPGPEDAELFPSITGGDQFWVYPVSGGTACTYAYGVTQQSARLLLAHLADTNRPTDIAMSTFCQDPARKCLVVWPMLISSHKAAGSLKKDSDIGGTSGAPSDNETKTEDIEEIREIGESWKIEHSAIMDALKKSSDSQNATPG